MKKITVILFFFAVIYVKCESNSPPIFTKISDLELSELTKVGAVVDTVEGYDPEGDEVSFSLIGSDYFKIDPKLGNITLIKKLDHEELDKITFLVVIRDKVNPSGNTDMDNIVRVPVTVIVLDENDVAPVFQNVPYEIEVNENTPVGTVIFEKILVTDVDTVGEILLIHCASEESSEFCERFGIEIIENTQNLLKAKIIINELLDYNSQTIYHFQLIATDGIHSSNTSMEVRVKDVQNRPPEFYGSLSGVIDEDSPINTLVLKVQAKDGDRGDPRKIFYDLLSNPMDYFLLDSKTGELRTAKPLDREALPDATGLIKLPVRAREIINGLPSSSNETSAITYVTVTIRDVNDSPPSFNQKEYNVSLVENTPSGTPLDINMNVTDKDVGLNSFFNLRLNDVSGVFEIEPTLGSRSQQVNIRVGNGTALDYENPNQRKFIVLVIAEETNTKEKLSSTATIVVNVIDSNDNKPMFEHESFSASVSESDDPGHIITTITAKDLDSGIYGDLGIRYSLSGTGSNLFNVNETTGVISLADCNALNSRVKRNTLNDEPRNVNITHNSETGKIDVHNSNEDYEDNANHLNTDYMVNSLQHNAQKCLDFEKEKHYFLSYKATDDLGRGQSSVVSLKIDVLDSNDSPPECENPIYRSTVDEGAKSFDSPLIVKARDADSISDINYRIVGDDIIHNLFDIDKRSGQITIRPNSTLDVTNLKNDYLAFSVEANDGIFSTNCIINITVRDVNNHAPQFLSESYVSTVPENSEIGSLVAELKSIDLDSGLNAEIKYRIQQGNFDDFRIDENSGQVSVSRKLDYDRRNTYQMEILAADSGTPSLTGTTTLTVSIINSNDKDPYFTPSTQRVEIREDAEIGSIIYSLIAIDPDAEFENLEFAATEPITAVDENGSEIENVEDIRDYFSIKRNGKVLINKQLDRKKFSVIQYTVLVIDSTAPRVQQGKGTLLISIIDVNEIPPKFVAPWTPEEPILKYQILEEEPNGTVLATLQAFDTESTIGAFNITPSTQYFEINETTGVITVSSRIDYEQTKDIKFFATVTDTGIPQLTSTAEIHVTVININDNKPEFEKSIYNFNITENSPKGTVVGKVEAKDLDQGSFGEITYSLTGEKSKYFLIDSYSGSIVVSNASILDHEKIPQITLSVIAEDKAPASLQKSAMATININVLDVNDNSPIFTQTEYFSKVAENAALNPPAALLQVKAEDLDEGVFGEIRYFFTSGNDDNLFIINSLSGIIYPAQTLQGKEGIYMLVVEARDNQGSGPHTSKTSVRIEVQKVNLYRPQFLVPASSNTTVEVSTVDQIIGADYLIMTVKAYDNDTGENGKIHYYLQVDYDNVPETEEFIIDKHTGELKTKKVLNIKNNKYNLILVAQDQGSPSQFETLRFLSILLVDGNENRPEFPESMNPYKISINENSGRDVRIGKVHAFYKNKIIRDIYYYMVLGNEDGAFYLDKNSGDIFTNKSLDRELTDFFTLYILASSKEDLHISESERASFSIKSLERDTSIAKVNVTVLDVNDNEPVFERSAYYAGVNTKSAVNAFVTSVNATDKDFGENGKIEYSITATYLYKIGSSKATGPIVPSPFKISSDDGRITTSSFVAEFNQDRFEIEVIAKETQPPETYAKTKVYVWIFDSTQLIRIILSRPPSEVIREQDEIVSELRNASQHRIVVDEIRYHVDSLGRIRMDWCDLFFHAVDNNQQIVPVDGLLRTIDSNYDYLRNYYTGFAIENIVPAHLSPAQEEFDLALAGLAALIIVLFVGVISFIVLCCCLKHWNLTVPLETKRKETLIKKQIIEDLNTTENPLWIEQKLKLYEEQELTMQVFSEPDMTHEPNTIHLDRKSSFENIHPVDNTYATIQPRIDNQAPNDVDYATLRNNRVPSTYEFTGSTFQAPIREDDAAAELI